MWLPQSLKQISWCYCSIVVQRTPAAGKYANSQTQKKSQTFYRCVPAVQMDTGSKNDQLYLVSHYDSERGNSVVDPDFFLNVNCT
ncbi:hypothetical protein AVEN_158196-1 [Araneus ventricosus]|uniref:Uncharacterized protein n=1 Tax=Araneus ventricosus TaxID=182803 RepID=A0A4Y2GB77_ARAVE|nr:hypothetical protein AVEN_158196-1 [Araneus ventricosus]